MNKSEENLSDEFAIGLIRNVVINGNCRIISDSAFYNYSTLTDITIPSSVTSIGERAFCRCSRLQTITFDSGSKLTSISTNVFADCSSLASITIPDGVTSIGESAFAVCSSLTNITIPSSVTSIGMIAFAACSSLQVVDLTALDSVPTLGSIAFGSCHSELQLYVDSTMLSAFKSAPGWSDYESIITDDPVPSMSIQ